MCFLISGALEIILLKPSSITMYLNTQMRTRSTILGPVSFQSDRCKIREIKITTILDTCQEGYIREMNSRTLQKSSLIQGFSCLQCGKCCPSAWHIVISLSTL